MDLSRVGYVISICEYDERGKVVLRPDFRGQRLNLYFRDLTDGVGDMKLASIRLVTNDVRALARFYSVITGFTPVGIEDYVELETPTGTLAISSKRAVDIFNAGAAVPAANRSAIVEFEVKNVDVHAFYTWNHARDATRLIEPKPL